MRLHAERAARGDDFRPRVPWVQSSLGGPPKPKIVEVPRQKSLDVGAGC